MSRRSANVVIGLVVAALIGVALMAIPSSPLHQKTTLGLDLQGGLEVTLQAVPPKDRELTKQDLERSVEIMRDRVDRLGVAEPTITTQGDDQIAIQLPGIKDPAAAAGIIGKTAKLELFDLQGDLVPPTADAQGNPTPLTSLYRTLLPVQGQGQEKDSSEMYLFAPVKNKKGKTIDHKVVVGPVASRKEILDSKYVKEHGKNGELPEGHELLYVPENLALVTCNERFCPNVGVPKATYYYLFKYDPRNKEKPIPEMSGTDLNLKGTKQDFGTQGAENGKPLVLMDFTDKGADRFHDVTSTLASRGRVRWTQAGSPSGQEDNYAQQFAIVLDRQIKSAPTVSFRDNPNGIPGNNGAEITGIGDIQEAKDLALVLQTGALPYNFRQLEKTEISATLGKDSLSQAKKAA